MTDDYYSARAKNRAPTQAMMAKSGYTGGLSNPSEPLANIDSIQRSPSGSVSIRRGHDTETYPSMDDAYRGHSVNAMPRSMSRDPDTGDTTTNYAKGGTVKRGKK